MIDMFMKMWDLFKYPFAVCMSVYLIYYGIVYLNIIIQSKKTGKKPLPKHKKVKQKGVFEKLFIQAPKQIALDRLNYNPDTFTYQGIIIFEGKQGRGKTISEIEYATRMLDEFPKAKCVSNLAYNRQNAKLTHWKMLTDYKNGAHGVVVIIDETQNWFSCKDSKNFPPEMLSVVTQNRKNRRIILGSAQSFYMLAKDIRTQCTEVRSCFTILGCITFVLRREPICNSAGDVEKWKYRGFYWYVHTQELRDAYDTYEVIDRMSKAGWNDRPVVQNTETVYANK